MKKILILCNICLIFSSCYTYNHVRKMENDLTVKGLMKTKNAYAYGIFSEQYTPLDVLLQKDHTYLFQSMDMINSFLIEGTPVNGIDWRNAFDSSVEKWSR